MTFNINYSRMPGPGDLYSPPEDSDRDDMDSAIERVAEIPEVLAESLEHLSGDLHWDVLAEALNSRKHNEFCRLIRGHVEAHARELIENRMADQPWLSADEAAGQIERIYT